ncbi:hypothetical protein CEXT_179671 [Caerostris extrusa]|uniref:Uncharacterized protein n=1 Tax=Caerostris extrusa TaxID=172846 RepID=A0AAV4QIN1_CAEEX|nr:hypothetical protein CEXT_179671 [Caerostris extrusa]
MEDICYYPTKGKIVLSEPTKHRCSCTRIPLYVLDTKSPNVFGCPTQNDTEIGNNRAFFQVEDIETTGQLGILTSRERKQIPSYIVENVATTVLEASKSVSAW